MNSLAAPDVRAPSVRGRWHFRASLARFPPSECRCSRRRALASPAAADIPLALMNDAIKPGPENPPQAAGLPQLSVVVPTFNERDNVTVLYRRLDATLDGHPWEVVFVDDNSPDGTWEVVRGLARQDPRVRCIRRIGRRGLSGACIEGHSRLQRALCGGDRRRSAARRDAAAEDGGAAAERRGGTRGRQPLYRGRQRRQFQQAARRRQRACHRSRQGAC